jgi:DNA-binding IclR family transcriptional regulator
MNAARLTHAADEARQLDDTMSSVSRVLAILEALVRSDGRALGVSQLAVTTGMPKSSAHRLLKAMELHGYIGREGSKYRVGSRALLLSGAARWSQYGVLLDQATPALEWLLERSHQTVHLGLLDGTDTLYLEKINAPSGGRIPTRIGRRVPAETTPIGRVLLAGTKPTGRATVDHRAWVAAVQATGTIACRYANQPQFAGIAAPIRISAPGLPPVAISVDGPVARIAAERHAGLVKEAATRLTRSMAPYLADMA